MEIGRLIDSDFASWYPQGLPPSLAPADGNVTELGTLAAFDDRGHSDFSRILANSLFTCDNPRLTYHGIDHAQRVTDKGAEALDEIQIYTGVQLPAGFIEAVLLGLSQHDRGHPGATFFADANQDQVPIDINGKTSVEWYSAKLFDRFAAEAGLSRMQRLLGVYAIWSSTYGGACERGQKLGLDRIKPKGIIGESYERENAHPKDERL